nr:unnamed protein product [Callosobruchus chinensis]
MEMNNSVSLLLLHVAINLTTDTTRTKIQALSVKRILANVHLFFEVWKAVIMKFYILDKQSIPILQLGETVIQMLTSLLDSARTREMSHSLEETSPLSSTLLKPDVTGKLSGQFPIALLKSEESFADCF